MSSLPRSGLPAPQWRQAAHDVHVATVNGEFAGYVTADAAGYTVHDRHAIAITTLPTLAAARAALPEGSNAPRNIDTAPRGRRRLPRRPRQQIAAAAGGTRLG